MPGTTRKKAPAKNAQSKSAKKAVSSASAFKTRIKPVEVELPSGNVALVRRPGMEALISQGLFTDSLMPIIQGAMANAKGGKPAPLKELDDEAIAANPKLIVDMMSSMDKILVKVVVQPKVRLGTYTDKDEIPEGYSVGEEIPDDERDDEILYADEVDMDDKMFIFQYVVGGDADLATFREQSSESLAAVLDGADVSVPTE